MLTNDNETIFSKKNQKDKNKHRKQICVFIKTVKTFQSTGHKHTDMQVSISFSAVILRILKIT